MIPASGLLMVRKFLKSLSTSTLLSCRQVVKPAILASLFNRAFRLTPAWLEQQIFDGFVRQRLCLASEESSTECQETKSMVVSCARGCVWPVKNPVLSVKNTIYGGLLCQKLCLATKESSTERQETKSMVVSPTRGCV